VRNFIEVEFYISWDFPKFNSFQIFNSYMGKITIVHCEMHNKILHKLGFPKFNSFQIFTSYMGKVTIVHCEMHNKKIQTSTSTEQNINPLNTELNPICHLLALLGGATIVVVSRLRVKHHLPSNLIHDFL
jgi:hypothetical protein